MKNIVLDILFLLMGIFIGALIANKGINTQIKDIQEVALESCNQRLSDPHHCVSVCVEQFEKFGC